MYLLFRWEDGGATVDISILLSSLQNLKLKVSWYILKS